MSILLIILLISLLNKQPKQDKLSISAPLTLKKKIEGSHFLSNIKYGY